MSNYNNLVSSDTEKLTHCPYNRAHTVTYAKLAIHLEKCRRTYDKDDIKICKFNTTHHIKDIEYNLHLQNCPDRIIIHNHLSRIRRKSESDSESENQIKRQKVTQVIVNDEDWENCEKKTYNPQKYLENSNLITHVQHMTKSQRETIRLERKKKINELELKQLEREKFFNFGASTSRQNESNKSCEVQKRYQESSPTAFREDSCERDEEIQQKSPFNTQKSSIDDDDIFSEHKKTKNRHESSSSSSVMIIENNCSRSASIITVTSSSSQNLPNYHRSSSQSSSNCNQQHFRDFGNVSPSNIYHDKITRNDHRARDYHNENYSRNYRNYEPDRNLSVQNFNNLNPSNCFYREALQNSSNFSNSSSFRNFNRNSQNFYDRNQRRFYGRGRGRNQHFESRNDYQDRKSHSSFRNNDSSDNHQNFSYCGRGNSRQSYRQNDYRNYTNSPSSFNSRSRSRSRSLNSNNSHQDVRITNSPMSISSSSSRHSISIAGIEIKERTEANNIQGNENYNRTIEKSNERDEFCNKKNDTQKTPTVSSNCSDEEDWELEAKFHNQKRNSENGKIQLNKIQERNSESPKSSMTQNCDESQSKRKNYSELFPTIYENLRTSDSERSRKSIDSEKSQNSPPLFDPNIKIKIEPPDEYPENNSTLNLNEKLLEAVQIKEEPDYRPPQSFMEKLRQLGRKLSECSNSSSTTSYLSARQSIETSNNESSNNQKILIKGNLNPKKNSFSKTDENCLNSARTLSRNLTEHQNEQYSLNYQNNCSNLLNRSVESSLNEEQFSNSSKIITSTQCEDNSSYLAKDGTNFSILENISLSSPKNNFQISTRTQNKQISLNLPLSSSTTRTEILESNQNTSIAQSNLETLKTTQTVENSSSLTQSSTNILENSSNSKITEKSLLNNLRISNETQSELNTKDSQNNLLNSQQEVQNPSSKNTSTKIQEVSLEKFSSSKNISNSSSVNSIFDPNIKIKIENAETESLSIEDHPKFRTFSLSNRKDSTSIKISLKSSKTDEIEEISSNNQKSRNSLSNSSSRSVESSKSSEFSKKSSKSTEVFQKSSKNNERNVENQSLPANSQVKKFSTNFKIKKLSSSNESGNNNSPSPKFSNRIYKSSSDSDATVIIENEDNSLKKSARIAKKTSQKAKSSKFDVLKMKRNQKMNFMSSNENKNSQKISSNNETSKKLPKMTKKSSSESSQKLSSEEILERYKMYRQQKSNESVSSQEFEDDSIVDRIYKAF
ncbi:hypothetical protein PVAND_014477 [Polypedilum vanderplanki]|uniref:CHHC U11-48K-type domain-containing protein n=1 Tax=Polypedilum vanderplanki TaxID=319348 RepID=A0A9J6B9A7_POLVA|nr:hypothetical protein PVAND_014477 [Polypedilum vanderplanki]